MFTINGHMLGHGDPIRVKEGERVLLHVVNSSASENRRLAVPGHTFIVVALDGNPVPNPSRVPVLWLGAAERISAVVELTNPGVWVLGDVADDDRGHGIGIAVEYAGRTALRGRPHRPCLPGIIGCLPSAARPRWHRTSRSTADRETQRRSRRIQRVDAQRRRVRHEHAALHSAADRASTDHLAGPAYSRKIRPTSVATAATTSTCATPSAGSSGGETVPLSGPGGTCYSVNGLTW